MNIKFFIFAICAVGLWASFLSAEPFTDDEAMPKPVSLLDNMENADGSEHMANTDLETYDPTVSFYVQNLNLTPEQIYKAQKISLDSLAEQEDLLQKIDLLRQRAKALEVSSLMAFEAILDDSQRIAFQELRANYEASIGESQPSSTANEAETF